MDRVKTIVGRGANEHLFRESVSSTDYNDDRDYRTGSLGDADDV